MSAKSDDLLRCLFQTVGVLVDTASLNDPYMAGHRMRCSQISRCITQILQFEEDMTDGIRLGATLHDIGMLLVPAHILSKPEKLTDEEMAAVRQHPVYGAEILKDIDFPWPVTQAVLQHHERLDGSGYPNGVKGKDILVEAQVIGLADAMDAMTADRPWRKALSVDEALAELRRDRDVKFDGYLVDACIELYTKQSYRLDPEYYGRT